MKSINAKLRTLEIKKRFLVSAINDIQDRHYDKKSISRSSFLRKVRSLNSKLRKIDLKIGKALSLQKVKQVDIEALKKNRTDSKIKNQKIKEKILKPGLKSKNSNSASQFRNFKGNGSKPSHIEDNNAPKAKSFAQCRTPDEILTAILPNLKNSIALDSIKSGPKKKKQKGYYKEFGSGGTRHVHKDYSQGYEILKKRGYKFNPRIMSLTAANKENIVRHLKEVHKK